MKACFKCGQAKPLTDFYRHPFMADGRLGKCKACTRGDAHAHRLKNADAVRAYDRRRNAARGEGYWTAKSRKMRKANPMMSRANEAVRRAIMDGSMVRPDDCSRCGVTCRPHAHHDDHAKKFDVIWLCPACHAARHVELGRIGGKARAVLA